MFEDTKEIKQKPYINEGHTLQWPKEKVQITSTTHYT